MFTPPLSIANPGLLRDRLWIAAGRADAFAKRQQFQAQFQRSPRAAGWSVTQINGTPDQEVGCPARARLKSSLPGLLGQPAMAQSDNESAGIHWIRAKQQPAAPAAAAPANWRCLRACRDAAPPSGSIHSARLRAGSWGAKRMRGTMPGRV